MYYLKKTFELPIGHRLSKHQGRCSNIHGHNFKIIVTISSEKLNMNDMVMDFSDLKKIVNFVLDDLDHGLMINKCDHKFASELSNRILEFDCDPTAEVLGKFIFEKIQSNLMLHDVILKEVAVYENEDSVAIYREE